MDRLLINMSLHHCLIKSVGSNQLMDVLNEGVHISVREVGFANLGCGLLLNCNMRVVAVCCKLRLD
jgi:hypothetical protein